MRYFFLKSLDAEIDILIKDGKRIVVEVKSKLHPYSALQNSGTFKSKNWIPVFTGMTLKE
jgi:hypothetical protein